MLMVDPEREHIGALAGDVVTVTLGWDGLVMLIKSGLMNDGDELNRFADEDVNMMDDISGLILLLPLFILFKTLFTSSVVNAGELVLMMFIFWLTLVLLSLCEVANTCGNESSDLRDWMILSA